MAELYPYQQVACDHLVGVMQEHGFALDASDTGTGKTYTSLGVARQLGDSPLIVCPKSVRSSWASAAESLGVKPIDVLNIEKLKTGRTPYLKKSAGKKPKFYWELPQDSLVLWDECQNAGGQGSQNSTIMAMLKAYHHRALCLSATVAETPLKMRSIGFLLGLHSYRDFWQWCQRHGCYSNPWGGFAFPTGKAAEIHMKAMHERLFPEHGYRIRIPDLGDAFPETQITAESYNLGDRPTKEVESIYAEMEDKIADPDSEEIPLTVMLRARQKTELLKVPLLTELTHDYLDEGKSVVIFVNFRDTIYSLQQTLGHDPYPHVVIQGGQSAAIRDNAIKQFQADAARVMICAIQAGGVGVSLHDLHGNHPRVALLAPSYNAVEMKQALGRVHRAGGKTKSIQRIVFAADTIEEAACKAVRRKLNNLSLLNDGDLTGGLAI